MALTLIPFDPTYPDQIFNVVLGGVNVRLRLTWLDRLEGWYCSVSRPDGTHIVDGVRLDDMYGVYYHYPDRANLPDGQIFCLDLTGERTAPARSLMGGRYVLLFGSQD